MFHKRKAVVVRDMPPEAVEPETVKKTVYVEDERRPRFFLGLILGALLVAGGVAVFATNEGSYKTAGATVDQTIDTAQDHVKAAANSAQGQALE